LHTDAVTQVSLSSGAVCFAKVSPAPAPGPAPAPAPPPEFRFFSETSEGSCSDIGGFPINDVNLCQRAAAVLGFPDRIVSVTTAVNRPEGCYVFNGFCVLMAGNPQSKDKGAETSTPGRSRHPICGFTS